MRAHRGFTLIELSIVLVIIGLIIGGVLVGRDLIIMSEMRKQMRTVDEIKSSFNTFRLKYNCLPGDCPNATQFFGYIGGTLPCQAYSLATSGTCDGNNNGQIESWDSPEESLMIDHLSLANLIHRPLLYTTDQPRDSFFNTSQTFRFMDDPTWFSPFPSGFGFWALLGDSTIDAVRGFIFDNKYDDGLGLSGNIRVYWEELDTNDPTSCIDSTGTYRQTGATMMYCHIYIDFPY